MRFLIILLLLIPALAGASPDWDKHPALADYAVFESAKTAFSSGQYLLAADKYQELITGHPQSLLIPKAKLALGKSYFNLKKYSLARVAFNDLIANYPEAVEAPEARYLNAKMFELTKNWKGAYLAYQEAELFHPLSFFGKKSKTAALALKKKHKKGLPKFIPSADALFKKGMAYFEDGDFTAAVAIFSQLAKEYPKSRYVNEAWLMLGRAEMQTNQLPDAITNLGRAAEAEPGLAGKANYYMGQAYARRGNYKAAIASMQKILNRYPDSGLADDAAYWLGYYQEQIGDTKEALLSYYNLINKYPYSKSVSAAVWRIGKTYYWNSDFKNASTYLHLAQLYPPGENTPRCYYFEGKALERQGNRGAALEVYKKLAERFDHTYYAYRALEKTNAVKQGFFFDPLGGDDFSEALEDINDPGQSAELSAIMEIWQQANDAALNSASSEEASIHFIKYNELMELGLTDYAADEARYLVNITSDTKKDSAQIKLAETLIKSGEYRTPIRFADSKVKNAVFSGKSSGLSKKLWQMAYPKGYWKSIDKNAARYNVDPYLVLAVIREESRFNPRATSRSGARGLMQIMPKTGRGIARNLEFSRYRTSKLYEPSLNITMGSFYLSNLIKNFSDNFYLALAGYNGGPNRIKGYVNAWYNGELRLVDIDEFVESIPSRETRLYVQKVMESYFEYKRLYERKRG